MAIYDKNWSFQLNTEPTDQTTLQKQCQSWFIQLKTFLITAGWSVESSSDGTTYSATTDLWGTDLTKINWNTNTSARSWILLKSPVGIVAGINGTYLGDQSRVWLLLDCHGGSVTDYNKWSVYFHREKPTNGTPSITTIPTSTNGITLTSNTIFLRTTRTNVRWQFAYTSTGNFYALVTLNGLMIMHTALIVYPVSELGKFQGKDYPYGIGAQVSMYDSVAHMTFYINGLTWNGGMNGVLQHPVFNTWQPNGTAIVSIIYAMMKASADNSAAFPAGDGLTGGPYFLGARLPGAGDSESNQWLFNVYITAEVNSGIKYMIGKVSDIKFSGNVNNWNTTVDSIGVNPTYCNFYNVWFPVNTRFLA